MSTPSLGGRVALVTGASRGIGRAIALALVEAGAELIVTSTREGGTDAVVAAIEALGRRAVGVRCELASPADRALLVERALAAFGRVDLLVNNAAVLGRAPLEALSEEAFDRVLEVNLGAPFKLARALLPGMLERGHGRIVNVSSKSGTLGTPLLSAYCASKWGLNGLTRAMAEELKGRGIFVAAVLPGSVETDMLREAGFPPDLQPGDIAGVVSFLCAEAPAGMTGSLVEVFG